MTRSQHELAAASILKFNATWQVNYARNPRVSPWHSDSSQIIYLVSDKVGKSFCLRDRYTYVYIYIYLHTSPGCNYKLRRYLTAYPNPTTSSEGTWIHLRVGWSRIFQGLRPNGPIYSISSSHQAELNWFRSRVIIDTGFPKKLQTISRVIPIKVVA